MAQKNKESLSLFMKKQINEKSSKKTSATKQLSANKISSENKDDKDKKDQSGEEEMSEEEKVEEAKKASRNKAAQTDQTEMLKKLFMENVAKYLIIIAVLVIFSLGIIKYGPEVIGLLNGIIFKSIMSSFSR